MTNKKLTMINGGRDQLEQSLARALFGSDHVEINRLSALINNAATRPPPALKLVKTSTKRESTVK
jgi:hypothetical protein